MSTLPETAACPHCGAVVEGPEGTFCCSGCAMAFRVLSDAGLEEHYRNRQTPGTRPLEPLRQDWSLVDVRDNGTSCEAIVAVDGLTCASCVQVAEALLQREQGVISAEVSFATGRARVRYDRSVTLDDQARTLARVGYTMRPVGAASTIDRDPLIRLGVATFCAANVMGLSIPVYLGWSAGMDPRFARLFAWGALLLATPAATFAAAPFFRSAWHGLRERTLHMDLPLALAIGGLYVHGVIGTLMHVDTYLDSLTMLIALLLLGRTLEARGQKDARQAADLLALPPMATRVDGTVDLQVPSGALQVGDLIRLRGGEVIPGDGSVTHGSGRASLALVSGESASVPAIPGSRLPAGAELIDGHIVLQLSGVGGDTMLGQMQDALLNSTTSRRQTQADRLAPAFTAATLLFATLALATTPWLGGEEAIRRAVAVLVVACPCALSLARPLAVSAALSGLARRGLWLRSGDPLLALTEVQTVALDKTGTLTEASASVVDASDAALRIGAALEVGSAHPIARAIVAEAVARGIPLPRAAEVEEIPGVGVRGLVDDKTWTITGAGIDTVEIRGDQLTHLIRLSHVARPAAHAALARLGDAGVKVLVLTGDTESAAASLAADLAIPTAQVHAALSPLDKVALVDSHTAFVGDGLNDGPALAAAGVGLAVAHGAPSAIAAADGVIHGAALGVLADAILTARATQRTIRANLHRSLAYNALAVLAALAGLINPLVAAILMPISSLVVVATSAKLGRPQ